MIAPTVCRRSARRPAAAGAVVLALVATGCGGGSGEQVPWAIVESGPRGRTLIVQPLTDRAPCEQAKAEIKKSNANRVELAVTLERPDGDCPMSAVATPPLSVKLAQPLRGQQIGGPQMRSPAAIADLRLSSPAPDPPASASTEVPSVVGFRIPDARAILAARGLEIGAVVGPTADATEVTSQSPPGGEPKPVSGKVGLRTVPR